jgi:hypothetical protein
MNIQIDDGEGGWVSSFTIPGFDRLPEIAQRLGVKPGDSTAISGVWLAAKDGQHYELFTLIEALLDRMDKINEHQS